ncbi:MAG TPA: ABC transporter permease [Methylocella sp.]|jgi:capsular polysaccharide transport system permease protein
MPELENRAISLGDVLRTQGQVIYALMLRDVKTRYFGNGLGFLFSSVAWPLVHVLVLLTVYTSLGRTAPFGNSTILFFATGLVPFMTFSYMSRWIMIGLVLNRPLIVFPVVKITDVLIARAFLEILGACMMTASLFLILWFCEVDFMPRDIAQASFAFGASVLLGLGMGIINAIIATAFVGWMTGYALIIISLYISSGVMFVPDSLPEVARYYLSFNPVLQAIEWMRSAYYDGYGSLVLDKTYLMAWAACTIFSGFALERLIRGRLLGG